MGLNHGSEHWKKMSNLRVYRHNINLLSSDSRKGVGLSLPPPTH